MRSSGGLTSSGMTLLMRKTFVDFTQALTIRTRGPVEPVVGARTRNRMQGEAMRTISSSTGNPWTYQWCKPCRAKDVRCLRPGACNPNPWARDGWRPCLEYSTTVQPVEPPAARAASCQGRSGVPLTACNLHQGTRGRRQHCSQNRSPPRTSAATLPPRHNPIQVPAGAYAPFSAPSPRPFSPDTGRQYASWES